MADPVATFFSTKGNGKVNKEQWTKIKFKHHEKLPNSNNFAQSHLCLDYQEVAGYCKLGAKCTENHCSRQAMLKLGDVEMKKKVLLVDFDSNFGISRIAIY